MLDWYRYCLLMKGQGALFFALTSHKLTITKSALSFSLSLPEAFLFLFGFHNMASLFPSFFGSLFGQPSNSFPSMKDGVCGNVECGGKERATCKVIGCTRKAYKNDMCQNKKCTGKVITRKVCSFSVNISRSAKRLTLFCSRRVISASGTHSSM